MKKLWLILLIPFILGAAPSRQVNYVDGETILDTDVESNENVVFDYLQTGVTVIGTDAVKDTHIDFGTGTNQVSQDDVTDGATYKQYNPASVSISGGTITGITDLTVSDGGTGVSTLSSGYVLLGNGTSTIQSLDVTGSGSIIIGDGTTAPTTLSAFTTSTGTLKHESGGLEADVSAYTNGLYGQASGATADIDTIAEVETAIGGTNIIINTEIDTATELDTIVADENLLVETEIDASSELAAVMDDETGTAGSVVFSVAPTLTGTAIVASINASGTVTGSVVDAQYLEYSSGGALTIRDDLTINGLIISTGDLTVTGGDITLATSAILSGGDITSLNLIDAIDATTEVTLEAALDIAGEVTSTGMASTVIADSISVTSWNLTTPTITTSLATSTPTTLSAAELDRLDGLAGVIATDTTACTEIDGTNLTITTGVLNVDNPVVANLTGNASGTAATVTGAAQANITSLGTLTTLTVDDITINGNTISSAGASTLAITPTAGQTITFDGTITLDAGVVAGATSITSTTFVGALTGTASGNLTSASIDTSAEIIAIVGDETGIGALVFANTPALVTPAIGAATGTSLTTTGLIQTGQAGTDGQLKVYSEQGVTDYSVVFNPHVTMTQDVVYTLPADDGTANQLLKTDGAGALSWATSAAGGDTLDVITVGAGGDYTTIQGALDAATPGDTILVSEGTYTEAITFADDNITLKATGSKENTTITQAAATVVNFSTMDNCVLEGFTITLTAANGATDYCIAGASDGTSECIIRDCKIAWTAGAGFDQWYAINVTDGDWRFENSTITATNAQTGARYDGGAYYLISGGGKSTFIHTKIVVTSSTTTASYTFGIRVASATNNVEFQDCEFDMDSAAAAGFQTAAFYLYQTGTINLRNNKVVVDNSSNGVALGIEHYTGTLNSYNNIFDITSTSGVENWIIVEAGTTLNSYGDIIIDGTLSNSGTANINMAPDNTTNLRLQFNDATVDTGDLFIDFWDVDSSIGSIAGTADAAVIAYATFTGSHYTQVIDKTGIQLHSLLEVIPVKITEFKTGKTEKYKDINGKEKIREKKSNAKVKGQLFKTRICKTKQSKSAIGSYGGTDDEGRDLCLSIGTGFLIVANKGINIEIGDLLISSDVEGCVEKQADDLIHNYTVGKSTENIIWNMGEQTRTISVVYLGG